MKPLPFSFSDFRTPPPVILPPQITEQDSNDGSLLPIFLLCSVVVLIVVVGYSIHRNNQLLEHITESKLKRDHLKQFISQQNQTQYEPKES